MVFISRRRFEEEISRRIYEEQRFRSIGDDIQRLHERCDELNNKLFELRCKIEDPRKGDANEQLPVCGHKVPVVQKR